MGESEGISLNMDKLKNFGSGDFISAIKDSGIYGIIGALFVAVVIPIILSVVFREKKKQRGVPVQVGGEPGVAIRNARFSKLVEVPWEGAATLAALFEQSCKKHSGEKFLGTRKVIGKDFVTGNDGRKFEKLHLGEYQWETYRQAFERACNFASGLIKLGHDPDTRAAIFAETRPEWLIAFHVMWNVV